MNICKNKECLCQDECANGLRMDQECGPNLKIVHVMKDGKVLCGLPELKRPLSKWPPRHWVIPFQKGLKNLRPADGEDWCYDCGKIVVNLR